MAAFGSCLAMHRCVKLYCIGCSSLSYAACGLTQLMSVHRASVQSHRCLSTASSATPAGVIKVKYSHGFASLSVPLPSRREQCLFTFLPSTQTVDDLLSQLKREDRGTDYVAVYSVDGDRLAKSTPIDVLLRRDFHITINDKHYTVKSPLDAGMKSVDELKSSISQLYSGLNVELYQLEREHQLKTQLDELEQQIEPYEQLKRDIALKSVEHTNRLTWLGLGAMGLQFGLLARLTWWEYSWDIMEPVTYFVGYGSAIAMFGYYILTRQEYIVPDVRDREFLAAFHRQAEKQQLDVTKYDELRDKIRQTEYDLHRLRDPLHLDLPAEYLDTLSNSQAVRPAYADPLT